VSDLTTVIKQVQVTEKSNGLAETRGKYFLRVDPRANKVQIRQAVEAMFGVKVADVNTMRYMGKRKRSRTARYGKCADWKRAVVTLQEGQRIELT
jgi:large subunit ribosomal protein L23